MNSLSNNRWIFVSVGHYFLLFLISQLNNQLSQIHIHITVTGLAIAFSALQLNFKQSALSLLPLALSIDSKSPLPFGTSLTIILSLNTVIFMIRSRVRRENAFTSIPVSLALNLSVFSAYTIYSIKHFGWEQISLSMTLWNLFVSSFVVGFLHSLYFELQNLMLEFIGIRIAEEQREN